MSKNNTGFDFLGDAIKIFMDYVCRQLKRNPQYKPHPLIRAFQNALELAEGVKCDELVMTVTSNGKKDLMQNPYIVVLEKKKKGVEVKEIRNMLVNKTLPIDVMITVFRLQINLDKTEGDTVNPEQMVSALNKVIPGNRFYALGDRWEEAREMFKKLLEKERIRLPDDPELKKELSQIKWDESWEDYSHKLRTIIGQGFIPYLNKDSSVVVVTSPKNAKIEKSEVFDIATEFMLGETAKYLDLFGKSKK